MKMIADAMLGRLAKTLRFLGFDVLYFQGSTDLQLIRTAQREGRTILTRDSDFLSRKRMSVPLIFIKSNDLPGQLSELGDVLAPDGAALPPRCTSCNGVLLDAAKDERLRPIVPDFVFHHCDVFSRCAACGKVYWPGTHYRHFHETTRAVCRG